MYTLFFLSYITLPPCCNFHNLLYYITMCDSCNIAPLAMLQLSQPSLLHYDV